MNATLAVSGLAWPAEADREALDIVAAAGCDALEVVPAKIFAGWPVAAADAKAYRRQARDAGLRIRAMQSIFFGVGSVSLFGPAEARARMAEHLRAVADLAGALGAEACVFGAPKLRDPGTLSQADAFAAAAEFFAEMGEVFVAAASCLTIEACSTHYGCGFVTNTAEAIALVRRVGHPGIRLQIDTGAMFLENEDPAICAAAVPLAGHFHASEPDLVTVGSVRTNHREIAAALSRAGYAGSRSIEMREQEDWRRAVGDAITFVRATYDSEQSA